MKEEFAKLVETLKMERDEIKLKVHLASMDVKKEFEAADFDIIVVDISPGAHCNVIKALQGSGSVITITEPTPLVSTTLSVF